MAQALAYVSQLGKAPDPTLDDVLKRRINQPLPAVTVSLARALVRSGFGKSLQAWLAPQGPIAIRRELNRLKVQNANNLISALGHVPPDLAAIAPPNAGQNHLFTAEQESAMNLQAALPTAPRFNCAE